MLSTWIEAPISLFISPSASSNITAAEDEIPCELRAALLTTLLEADSHDECSIKRVLNILCQALDCVGWIVTWEPSQIDLPQCADRILESIYYPGLDRNSTDDNVPSSPSSDDDNISIRESNTSATMQNYPDQASISTSNTQMHEAITCTEENDLHIELNCTEKCTLHAPIRIVQIYSKDLVVNTVSSYATYIRHFLETYRHIKSSTSEATLVERTVIIETETSAQSLPPYTAVTTICVPFLQEHTHIGALCLQTVMPLDHIIHLLEHSSLAEAYDLMNKDDILRCASNYEWIHCLSLGSLDHKQHEDTISMNTVHPRSMCADTSNSRRLVSLDQVCSDTIPKARSILAKLYTRLIGRSSLTASATKVLEYTARCIGRHMGSRRILQKNEASSKVLAVTDTILQEQNDKLHPRLALAKIVKHIRLSLDADRCVLLRFSKALSASEIYEWPWM
jgi:hypothetical protein